MQYIDYTYVHTQTGTYTWVLTRLHMFQGY